MKTFIVSILKTYFLHCNYAPHVIIDKLDEITGHKFSIKEIRKVKNEATISVDNMHIVFDLTDTGYVRDIRI